MIHNFESKIILQISRSKNLCYENENISMSQIIMKDATEKKSLLDTAYRLNFKNHGKDPCFAGMDLYLVRTRLYLVGTNLHLLGTDLYLNFFW